jgi:SAM-dependent methyltransferase
VKFTGERVIPGECEPDLLNEHMARYRFAQRFAAGKVVLDAACGSGYGAAMLAENATAVVGCDISPEAIEYARRVYGASKGGALRVEYCEADCFALPFPSARFDLVVAFEIIEHLENPEAFLKEMDRVLGPAGLLLVSTPNRLYYTEERGEINPFHRHEFTFDEFDRSLQAHFAHRAYLFENHVAGVFLAGPGAPADALSPASIVAEKTSAAHQAVPGSDNVPSGGRAEDAAHYIVAVCSRRLLEPIAPLLYLPSTGNVLRERETHIRQLTGHLANANAEAERARAAAERAMAAEQQARTDAERALAQLRAEMEELRAGYERRLQDLNHLIDERTQWGQRRDREIAEKNSYLLQLQKDHDEKVQWALKLDREIAEKNSCLLQLQKDHDEKVQWALKLDQEVAQTRASFDVTRAALDETSASLDRLQKEFEERTAWALRLDAEIKERQADLQTVYGSLWYRIGKNLHLSPVPPSDRS